MKFFATLPILALAACSGSQEKPENYAADTLYVNAVVWTGIGVDAEAFAVKNGKVVFSGAKEDFRSKAKSTVDLHGRFVMPGFIDNHVHFLDGGFSLASVDLRDAATPDEFSKRIADYAATLPEGQWIREGNWDHERWGGELPRKEWVDAATPNTPVFVLRLDGHMALANSAAMKLAKITAETQSPEGGEIVRDENNEPTGIFKDNAMNLFAGAIPEPTEAEALAAFDMAQTHALSLGLTQVHDVGSFSTVNNLAIFQAAHAQGRLKLRIYSMAPIQNWEAARDRATSEGTGEILLRWGALKGFVDGSLGSTTAWFYEPFTDTPQSSGFPVTMPDQLAQMIADADAAGLHLAVHAIGDKAIDTLLGDFEATAGNEIAIRRYRIEHFQHPSRAAIQRAARDGVIASMQPYHAIDDGRWAERRIGPARIKTTYAFRSILDAGGILTFGSDWPVAPLSPLEGVYAAVTRRTIDGANPNGWQPQEKIGVEEALLAYTATNAYAGLQEKELGVLTPGMAADFIVLSDDPRSIDPVSIRDIRVLQTVIGGEVAYEASE